MLGTWAGVGAVMARFYLAHALGMRRAVERPRRDADELGEARELLVDHLVEHEVAPSQGRRGVGDRVVGLEPAGDVAAREGAGLEKGTKDSSPCGSSMSRTGTPMVVAPRIPTPSATTAIAIGGIGRPSATVTAPGTAGC